MGKSLRTNIILTRLNKNIVLKNVQIWLFAKENNINVSTALRNLKQGKAIEGFFAQENAMTFTENNRIISQLSAKGVEKKRKLKK